MDYRVLGRPWRIERFVYRHHRWFGGFIVVGALAIIALLSTARFWTMAPVLFLTHRVPVVSALLWGLAIAILLIGVIVLVRPSVLKGFESLANRSIAPFSGSDDSSPVDSFNRKKVC